MNCSPVSFVRYVSESLKIRRAFLHESCEWLGLVGALNPCPIYLLPWQTPDFFDLAKSYKQLFIIFINGCSFRYAEKLDEVSMGTVKYDKRIRAVRPAPMLAEVTQFFGFW